MHQLFTDCSIDADFTGSAWRNTLHQHGLQANATLAKQYGINAVPGFVFGNKVLTGVISEKRLRHAATDSLLQQTPS